MKRSSTLILFLLALSIRPEAQQVVFGDLIAHINSTIDDMPGSSGNQFSNLTPSQEIGWRALIGMIQDKKYSQAAGAAPTFEYRLVRFLDNSEPQIKEYYLLEKTANGVYHWGTYVFRPDACRRLVLQCPHPKVDSNTGNQGIYVFKNLNNYAYFLTGTHRCNHISPSGCSGSTSVCGTSAPYRRSDVAHNTLSAFQVATEVLYDGEPELYFLQLHGFALQSGDPYAIMSNGTRDTPDPDLLAAIRDGLLDVDPSLTFKIGHIDLSWDRLLATTNTQGRFINGSNEPCTQNATFGNGHFMHVEQEFSKLRANQTAWDKMLHALELAVECTTVSSPEKPATAARWTFSSDRYLTFHLPENNNYELRISNLLGQTLQVARFSTSTRIYLEHRGFSVFTLWSEGRPLLSGKVCISSF